MFTLYLDGTLKSSNNVKSFNNATQCVCLLAAYCEHLNLNVCLVGDQCIKPNKINTIHIDHINGLFVQNGFKFPKSCFKDVSIKNKEDVPKEIQNCNLPAIISADKNYIISGLCHILRILVKESSINTNADCVKLLGHKKFCLKATSEVSSRGNLCEVDGPKVIDEWLCSNTFCHSEKIPAAIRKLENLLSQPVAIHNMDKKQRIVLQKLTETITTHAGDEVIPPKAKVTKTEKCSQVRKLNVRTNDLPPLEHVFVEGVELMISDLALLPLAHAYLTCHAKDLDKLRSVIPLTILWYHRLQSISRIMCAAKLCCINFLDVHNLLHPSEKFVHDGEEEILKLGTNSSQNTFQNIKKKDLEKTIRRDLPSILNKIALLVCDTSKQLEAKEINLHWDELPSHIHPTMGDLSSKRATRKCQQIENILHAVRGVCVDGNIIVDFCAGGGHVGIVIAHMLPHCKVVILDNKEESLDRARSRIHALGLTNVVVYQCNLQNYKGHYDIGLALHACGVATDLVLHKCLKANASFVISPCCYGKIQNTHHVSYPQSELVRNTEISYQEFILLGHAGDQTSWDFKGEKPKQGKHCMGFIDMDRISFAAEKGYQSSIFTLQPHDCSPKNNMIVGVAPPIKVR